MFSGFLRDTRRASGLAALNLPRREAALRSASQHAAAVQSGVEPTLVFGAMRRWMIEKDPSFLG
jgi:hypothetical protein